MPRETIKSLLLVLGIALLFLLWGIFIFFSVGEKGMPPWDFGAVDDVPGSSVYGTVDQRPLQGVSSPLEKQHVDGENKRKK